MGDSRRESAFLNEEGLGADWRLTSQTKLQCLFQAAAPLNMVNMMAPLCLLRIQVMSKTLYLSKTVLALAVIEKRLRPTQRSSSHRGSDSR